MTPPRNQPVLDPDGQTSTAKKQKRSRFLAWAVFNRDLSQLEFFRRLLEEATDKSVPLLEKLKFLSVFADNLDEFFMVRVSGLKEMLEIENLGPMPGELTPAEQLKVIRQRVLPLVEEHTRCLREEVLPGLKKVGVVIAPYDSLSKSEKRRLAEYFKKNVFLILTPQAVDPSHPFPYMSNLSLNIGLTVEHDPVRGQTGSLIGEDLDDEATVRFVRIKVPPLTPRLVPVNQEGLKFTLLEELIEANIHSLFASMRLSKGHLFRVTRDADVEIRDDKAADLLALIKQSLRERRFGLPVRLEVSSTMPREMVEYLTKSLRLEPDDVYEIDGVLDASDLMELYNLDKPELRDKPLQMTVPSSLRKNGGPFEAIKKEKLLLHHP